MTSAAARHYSKAALRENFKLFYGASFRHHCTVTRAHGRCAVSWFDGDFSFYGHTRIWYTRESGRLYWNYAYTITRVNTYCSQVQHRKHCTRTYRVG